MQTNAVLRKRAFRLYWQHRGMLWRIFLLFAVVNLLWYAVQIFLIENDLLESLLNIVYQSAAASVMILGLYHLLLRLIRGHKARWPMFLDFIRSPKVLPRALAIGLIWQLPAFILLLLGLLGKPGLITQEMAIFNMVAALAAGLLMSWIMLRLFMLPFLFVTNPQESMPAMIKSSFRIMRGKVRRLIWFSITVYWWGIVLLIGMIPLIPPSSVVNPSQSGLLMRQVVMSLAMAILNPYFNLALAGYANELLHAARDGR